MFLWIVASLFGMIFPIEASWAAEEGLYNAHGKRDPFVPLVTLMSRSSSGLVSVEGADDISIEGILFDRKKGSIIIVNGAVLKEGERYGGLKVLKIMANGALFSLNGVEVFKQLYREEDQGKQN